MTKKNRTAKKSPAKTKVAARKKVTTFKDWGEANDWAMGGEDKTVGPTFKNGRPKPQLNKEPLLDGADALIEKALARKHPELHQVRAPAGYNLRGASTLLDADGNVIQTWVKTAKELDNLDELIEVVRAAVMREPMPAAAVIKKPSKRTKDSDELEVAVIIGDPHFGMLSWDKETGDNWDVEIARDIHTKAIREALRITPASSRLLLINLGDAIHADGNNATTTAGTRVDVDSRWPKVISIFAETMNLAINEGLQKHDHVELVTTRGNHDDLSSIVVRMILAEHWRNNPRVTIADNLKMIWSHRFGVNLICATHGDKTKTNNIPALIAQDFREDWGKSSHCTVYAGHVHSRKVAEVPGLEIEYFRSLTVKDQWHHSSGYRSLQSLRTDVWHARFGRIASHEIGIEQLKHT